MYLHRVSIPYRYFLLIGLQISVSVFLFQYIRIVQDQLHVVFRYRFPNHGRRRNSRKLDYWFHRSWSSSSGSTFASCEETFFQFFQQYEGKVTFAD